jgi:hypothetical protein
MASGTSLDAACPRGSPATKRKWDGSSSDVLLHRGAIYMQLPRELVSSSKLLAALASDTAGGSRCGEPARLPTNFSAETLSDWISVSRARHAAGFSCDALSAALQVRPRLPDARSAAASSRRSEIAGSVPQFHPTISYALAGLLLVVSSVLMWFIYGCFSACQMNMLRGDPP